MTDVKRIVVAAGLIRGAIDSPNGHRYLLSRRLDGAHLARWWEFPGGKVERGESPVETLHRELREELGIEVQIGPIFAVGYHLYDDREVILLVYEATHSGGHPRCIEVSEYAWLTAQEVIALELPPADLPVIERLREQML